MGNTDSSIYTQQTNINYNNYTNDENKDTRSEHSNKRKMTRQIVILRYRVINYYNKNKSRRVQLMCELFFVGVINGSGLDWKGTLS